jgi:serine/threonine protein kinase
MDTLENGLFEYLHSRECPFVVPYPVKHEIGRLAKSTKDAELSQRAKEALNIVEKRQKDGHIRVMGSGDENFADQTFLEVFTKFRTKYDLVLFTNDKNLCRDLLRLNRTESTSRCKNEIWVAWHSGRETLAANKVEDMVQNRRYRPEPDSRRPEPIFKPFEEPRVLDGTLIGGKEKYQAAHTLRTESGKSIRLGKALASGGEGEIFALDRDHVAKIYYPDRRTVWRSDKLALMCEQAIQLKRVNWPIHRLFGPGDSFVGYVMPLANGKTLQHSAFGKAAIQENFPNWNRLNLVTLARTVAEIVQSLNNLGVIVGDINPMNFLVAGDTEVHLVDVDSVQVGDFPCPVGMVTFRAPEITEPSFEKFLRNEHHEAFALASLLFMILMGGKSPFSFQGGGDPAENIRNGNFPYVKDKGNIPAGAYRYIWSFFPFSVQNAFERAFMGKDPSTRPSAAQWVGILDQYCRELRNPKIPEELEIWPSTFKPWNNKSLVRLRCAECSQVFQTSATDAEKRRKFPKILCNPCITVLTLAKKAGENHKCKRCGKLFHVAFHEVQKHGEVLAVCRSCVSEVAGEVRICKLCTRRFSLEIGETRNFLAKGLNLPKRCGPCRATAAGKGAPYRPQSKPPQTPASSRSPHPPQLPSPSRTPRPRREPTFLDWLKSLFE